MPLAEPTYCWPESTSTSKYTPLTPLRSTCCHPLGRLGTSSTAWTKARKPGKPRWPSSSALRRPGRRGRPPRCPDRQDRRAHRHQRRLRVRRPEHRQHGAGHDHRPRGRDPVADELPPGALYEFKVSTNGDAIPDVAYRIKFGETQRERHTGPHCPSSRWIGRPRQRRGRQSDRAWLQLPDRCPLGRRDDLGRPSRRSVLLRPGCFKHFKATLLTGSLADLPGLVDCSRTAPAPTDFFLGFNGMAIVLEASGLGLQGGHRAPDHQGVGHRLDR